MRLLLRWSPLPQARQLKELTNSQTGEGGEWRDGTELALPCLENLAASAQPRNLRPRLLQWKGSGKRRVREKGGVGKFSMTVYNLCFFGSLQTYNQEEPWSRTITGLPRPEDFYQQTSHITALLQGGAPLLRAVLSPSYPVSQIPNEWSLTQSHSMPHSSLNTSSPQAITAL